MSPNVPPGYKQTEVGVIPEEWEVKHLGDCLSAQPSYGINAAAVTYSDRLPVYIRITDITEDGRFLPEKLVSVNNAQSGNYFLNDGDIVFARTGASVGKSYRYKSKDGQLVFAGFLIRVSTDNQKLLPDFAAAYVTTGAYWNWVRLMSMRSGQPGINGNEYSQLPIPLPPLPEQRAIATALSDVDALIASLDRLITKKRDMKQAAMQELLTGKRRLPGFSGVWEEVAIGCLVQDFRGGAPFSPSDFIRTGVKVLPKGGVCRGGLLKVEEEDLQYCSTEYADAHQRNQVNKDYTIVVLRDLVPSGPSIGLIVRIPDSEKYVLAQGVYGFKVNELRASSSYLIQLSNTSWYRQVMNEIMVGSTQVHITNTAFKKVIVSLPPLPEQTAIAAILSDMDTEIAALEQKRDKNRLLKQGMMQELLTGRIRLV
ncbi:MAG: restriction endonuclease subunit S [Trichlorobacter sp.]|uniref:restriction endonuclease subunit S n=1 Tax=Trichlorobacter sp. TaxID=2911007 RepID=UPI002566E8C8|nr:restriction endonuclease subunit S [Trichlorobacter sp.]MDK9716554.1 restriction endonuclease subunit S [Trichlorobacter sp.]